MNIKVAICDDELEICVLLENMLIDIFEMKGIDYEIEPFCSGKKLCEEMQRQVYDLIFLDIELGEETGIDVGRYVRDELENESVQIAYISAKTEYAMELFEIRPINFLVKPIEYFQVVKLIDKYCMLARQNEHYFEYKKKTDYYKVPLAEILYFESKNRKIHIVMSEEEDEFYGSMDDIYRNVKEHKFLYIHKSIIVNYRKIKLLSYEEIVMIDGQKLPISQSRRTAIKKMCMKIRREEH